MYSKDCTSCGAELVEGASFCASCGAPTEAEAQGPTHSGDTGPSRCPSCGGDVAEGISFCATCGAPVAAVASAATALTGHCSACGAVLPAGASFCGSCGASVGKEGRAFRRDGQPSCPRCGSTDYRRERWSWSGGLIGAALAKRAICNTCGSKWRL